MRKKEGYQCLGLADDEVRLEPYAPAWALAFEEERAHLAQELGGLFRSIEHVGSTAIPHIVSKPIVDIALGVNDFTTLSQIISILEGQGYLYRGELGLTGRHFFKFEVDGLTRFHIHVVISGSEHWVNMVRFRDFLLSNESAANEYAEAKSQLQRRYATDRADYTGKKSPIIMRLLDRAKE